MQKHKVYATLIIDNYNGEISKYSAWQRIIIRKDEDDTMWPFHLIKDKTKRVSDSSPVLIAAAAFSDLGLVRKKNEDNYLLGSFYNASSEEKSSASFVGGACLMAGVFDGMGGGEAGEQASLCAARSFFEASQCLSPDSSRGKSDQMIRGAFQQANNQIVGMQRQLPVLGTTGVVLFFQAGWYKVFHLGDSRAYLFRSGVLTQLTRDQTLAQMKIELGLYAGNDETAQLEKHQLTDYIGRDWTEESLHPVESGWNQLSSGDVLLLCSDGLYECCSDTDIAGILARKKAPKETAEALVKTAAQKGGTDNCTVVLLYDSYEEQKT